MYSLDNVVAFDIEIYPNYSLFAFKNARNGKTLTIEIKGENSTLSNNQKRKLNSIFVHRVTFGFNSDNYDVPITLLALSGKTAKELCKASNLIIEEGLRGWQFMQRFGLNQPAKWKTFDLQEPAPGVRVSLKLYGGRMHSKRLQDLPIKPNSVLSKKDMDDTKLYCVNDLDTTIDLFNKIEKQMQLRVDMSKKYNQNLMSKSDAQIAEAVIKSELMKKRPGKRLKAPQIDPKTTYKYKAPSYIQFKSKQLQHALNVILGHDFELDRKGFIKLPSELKNMKIKLGSSVYQLGVGGLHSTEKSQTVIPGKNQKLKDADVASFYPSIILTLNLMPKQLGKNFLDIYRDIVKTRLHAKRTGDKVTNESLKITINGSFGKLGSKWSALYSPDLMIKVTLTGQLSLLMLIERLESEGIQVVSANTDGFVSLFDKEDEEIYDKLCKEWENETQFELEYAEYKGLYSRDVNNYLADKGDETKGKGIFAVDLLRKNPQAIICSEAAEKLMTKGIPVEKTIKECEDITKFLTVRAVSGGAVWKDQYLGRVVRWIYSKQGQPITYSKNGNKVAKSDGAEPVMELPDKLPSSINYEAYIEEAKGIIDDVGYYNM